LRFSGRIVSGVTSQILTPAIVPGSTFTFSRCRIA